MSDYQQAINKQVDNTLKRVWAALLAIPGDKVVLLQKGLEAPIEYTIDARQREGDKPCQSDALKKELLAVLLDDGRVQVRANTPLSIFENTQQGEQLGRIKKIYLLSFLFGKPLPHSAEFVKEQFTKDKLLRKEPNFIFADFPMQEAG